MVARDAALAFAPLAAEEAHTALAQLVTLWRANLDRPLPVACRTALAQVQGGGAEAAYDGGEHGDTGPRPESSDPALARLWPDFETLSGEPGWPGVATQLYGPLVDWIAQYVRCDPFGDASEEEGA
jgi:exodeoxyribonuclease V gamma subunit